MKTRSQIGRSARRKGAEFERFVARFIQAHLPQGYTARRRMQSRGGWREPDVGVFRDGDPRALWHIECKTGLRASLAAAVRQALAQRSSTAMVAVAVRRHREHPECHIVEDSGTVRCIGDLRALAREIAESLRDPVIDGLAEEQERR